MTTRSQTDEQLIDCITPLTAKAYLSFLSEGLSVEYESKGIYIQTVIPNQVKTKLTDEVHVPVISVSPEDYVRAAIKTVGIEYHTCGHWKHKLLAYFSNLVLCLIGRRLYMRLSLPSLIAMRRKYYRTHNLVDD